MDTELQTIADSYWEWYLAEHPSTAHFYGDYRYIDQMEDVSRQAEDDAVAELDRFTAAAQAVDPARLSQADRTTRSILIHEASANADDLRSRLAELAVDPSSGPHVAWIQVAGVLTLTEPEHAEAMLVKWTKLNGFFHQLVQRLKQGVARDRTPSRSAVEIVIDQVDRYLATPISADPFVATAPPPQYTEEQTADWREQLAATVEHHVRPGYVAFRDALRDDVLPHARPDARPGVCWLPDGEDVYTRTIRQHTTVDRPALDIHNTGREVIDGLAFEYRELGGRALGTSDLAAIYDRLRTDPELRFTDGAEIMAAANEAMARARVAVPDWFGRLPRTECVVEEIPQQGAEEMPAAYYWPPADDGSRPGTYVVNTSAPTKRTRFEAEAIAFHEALPGHHLQIALSQELEDIPTFQRHARATAFIEGWGLYTERLADEMGLYSDDLARLGMLSGDSLRAGRLVVDTGLHALGWSRQEAIDYLTDNSPQATIEIVSEVDRYIGSPGQALGYMVGRLEIERIRSNAERSLGDGFDIQAFHDVVLGSGNVTLPALAELVDNWVDSAAG